MSRRKSARSAEGDLTLGDLGGFTRELGQSTAGFVFPKMENSVQDGGQGYGMAKFVSHHGSVQPSFTQQQPMMTHPRKRGVTCVDKRFKPY